MMAFEVFTDKGTRRFDSFLAATFFFVRQPKASLVMETRHDQPGPDGSYVSRQVMAVRDEAELCTPPQPFRVQGGIDGEG